MRPLGSPSGIAVFAACLAIPATAVAAGGTHFVALPPPPVGLYTTAALNPPDNELPGTFSVTSSGYVTDFKGTIPVGPAGPGGDNCGTGPLSIPGKLKIGLAGGVEYAVGKWEPHTLPHLTPISIEMKLKTRTVKATFVLILPYGSGIIRYPGLNPKRGGSCALEFVVKPT